jgi:hypothetical protein
MTDASTDRLYRLVWDRIRELEPADLTDEKDEAERAEEARDYSTLVDLYDDLTGRLNQGVV